MNWRRFLLGGRRLWMVSLVLLFAAIALYVVLFVVALKAGSF
jgi:hypothetical protein